jgi:hypothetical protein
MIFYYTDNIVSKGVAEYFKAAGFPIKHVNEYNELYTPILYGILRGAAAIINHRILSKKDFWYVDNGYFDAQYIDQERQKQLTGTYRIVKNQLLHTYDGEPKDIDPPKNKKILIIPPTPYSAMMHDTTVEDWLEQHAYKILSTNEYVLRDKENKTPLQVHMDWCDTVLCFNSMIAMDAIKAGKAVETTHGILSPPWYGYYDYEDVKGFFLNKQTTLDKLGEFQWK